MASSSTANIDCNNNNLKASRGSSERIAVVQPGSHQAPGLRLDASPCAGGFEVSSSSAGFCAPPPPAVIGLPPLASAPAVGRSASLAVKQRSIPSQSNSSSSSNSSTTGAKTPIHSSAGGASATTGVLSLCFDHIEKKMGEMAQYLAQRDEALRAFMRTVPDAARKREDVAESATGHSDDGKGLALAPGNPKHRTTSVVTVKSSGQFRTGGSAKRSGSDPRSARLKRAQEDLLWVVSGSNQVPDPASIMFCVTHGASVMRAMPMSDVPIFFHFVRLGDVPCLQACLATTEVIDFTVTDPDGCTALHEVARLSSTEKAKGMFEAIVHRLSSHPFDMVDWEQRDNGGRDVFSWAAHYRRLSVLWSLVKDLDFFVNREDPIPVFLNIFPDDWEKLGEEGRRHFWSAQDASAALRKQKV